eukprot:jgi/Psemu1/31964/gm1.31964_g
MVVKYRPGGTTLSIQRTYFEKDLTVSAIINISAFLRYRLLRPAAKRPTRPSSRFLHNPRLQSVDSLADSFVSRFLRYQPPTVCTSKRPADSIWSTDPPLQAPPPEIPIPTTPITGSNMRTYTEYYQTTTSPLGVGPALDLAYQTIYDYFAEETAKPILLGRLLDLFEPEAYPGPLTAPSTNKGKAFGYLDDIKGDAGELVQVDAALLEQAPETLVLSLDRHLDVIKHAHHSHMIPMVLGDDPHME